MAGKKKEIQIEIPIHNEAEWDEMFEAQGLSVVDVHQGWCGPCKAIFSIFRKLKMEFGDELLHFHTVEASLIPLLQGFVGKCEPAFLFILAGKIVDYVKGVNGPVINNKIIEYLEMETEYYEKGVARQEIQTVQLYDVEDEIEEFIQVATSRHVDKIFTVVVIKPNAVITGNDNNIKEQISETGLQILAEETAQLTEEEAKELYEHKKHQRNYEEIVQTMSSGVCDVLLFSDEIKDFEFDVDEAEMAKTNDDDSDIRDLAHRLFSFFFPTIYEKYKKIERTLAIIRPQLLELRKGEIMEEIANARFTVGRQKEIKLSKRQLIAFYILSEKNDLPPEFVEYMISGPILALALLRDNAIKHWQNLLGPEDVERARQDYPASLRARFAFEDIPFNQLHGSQDIETAVKELQFFFPVEHTLVAIKPDTVRQYKDVIIAKIHEGNFTISAIKSVEISQEIAAEFYKDHEKMSFFNQLIEQVSQCPLVIMILTKENAVKEWNELMGPADLELAKTSFPNSLRVQLESSILKNGLHSSSNVKHAKNYIKLFFGDSLLNSFGIVLDEGLTISSTALLSVSPSLEPTTPAILSTEVMDSEASTEEQQINHSSGEVTPETQDIFVAGEFADSDTTNVSAPVEDFGSGTRDINDPGEIPIIGTGNIPAAVEIHDIGTEAVASPAEVSDVGSEDGSVFAEVSDIGFHKLMVPDPGIQDIAAYDEAPDSSTKDTSAPHEATHASILDVSTPGETPNSTSQDISVPSEAPDATPLDSSTRDVSIPGEAPDSTTKGMSAPHEAPDASTQDISIPGKSPDSISKYMSIHSEGTDPSILDVSTPDEAPNSISQNISIHSEGPDPSILDVSTPDEAPNSISQNISIPSEGPDANTLDISLPDEAPDSAIQNVPSSSDVPNADSQNVSALSEAPDFTIQDVSPPNEASGAITQVISTPDIISDASSEFIPLHFEAPDATSEYLSSKTPDDIAEDLYAPAGDSDASIRDTSVEAPGADIGGTSALEIPDSGKEDISTPIDIDEASSEGMPAPNEVPHADDGVTSASTESPDARTEDILVPNAVTIIGNKDASILSETH